MVSVKQLCCMSLYILGHCFPTNLHFQDLISILCFPTKVNVFLHIKCIPNYKMPYCTWWFNIPISRYKHTKYKFHDNRIKFHTVYYNNNQFSWIIFKKHSLWVTVILTEMTYFAWFWNVPKNPNIMKIISKKFTKIGIHI